METPSSTRRVTRSQALSALNSNSSNNNNNIPISRKVEESEKGLSKSRQRNGKQLQDRSALIDITNDSPIVGLASGSVETPSSSVNKQRNNRAKLTPGSGEALLRGQVKTLLQKVEEEAELSKLSLEGRPFLHLQGFVNSPIGLLAPTPANTPHISNLSGDQGINNNCLANGPPSPVVEEQLKISQVVNDIFDGKKQESLETEKSLVTRSLLLDFSEKSESTDSSECSSALTYQGEVGGNSEGKEKSSTDDDDASVWSIQVNASTEDENDEEVIEEDDYYDHEEENEYEEEEEEEEDGGGLVDELCEGMNKMSVNEKIMAKFTGKHTRFVYDSDDEIVEGEEEGGDSKDVSPGIVRLKGLPTPKGKHLRFQEEEEEDN